MANPTLGEVTACEVFGQTEHDALEDAAGDDTIWWHDGVAAATPEEWKHTPRVTPDAACGKMPADPRWVMERAKVLAGTKGKTVTGYKVELLQRSVLVPKVTLQLEGEPSMEVQLDWPASLPTEQYMQVGSELEAALKLLKDVTDL